MSRAPQPWYPYMGEYNKEDPPYYDLNGVAWYDKLKHDLPEIKEKLSALLKTEGVNVKEYFNANLVGDTGWWGGFAFMFWKKKNKKIINKGRDVFEYFKDIPGLVSLSVSVLKPKTHIKGHIGDTNAIYRIHVPVYIPAQLPDCGITVAGVTRPLVENELLVFCDAHFHEAWNMTDQPRIVMIIDVVKEEFLSQTDKVCSVVLASMRFQYLAHQFGFIGKLAEWCPLWVKNIVRKLIG